VPSFAPVIALQTRKSLTQARLRIVKRWPAGLVLTDGASLGLWAPCDPFARFGVRVGETDYAYVRRVRGREL
jgi:hypothetical protein